MRSLLRIGTTFLVALGFGGCAQGDGDGDGDGDGGDQGDGPPGISNSLYVQRLAYDPKGGRIYAGDSESTLWQCDPQKKNSCKNWGRVGTKEDDVLSLIFNPDNGFIYTGMTSGELWRCDTATASSCERFDSAKHYNSIVSLAHNPDNAMIYAGLDSGLLWSCKPDTRDKCETLDTAGHAIYSLLYDPDNGNIYAGIWKGTFWQCDPNHANRCKTWDDFGPNSASSLVFNATDGAIYAGITYGGLLRCDAAIAGSCATLLEPTSDETCDLGSLVVDPDTGAAFGGRDCGELWKCELGATACKSWGTFGEGIRTVVYAPNEQGTLQHGFIFVGDEDGGLWQCDPETPNSCELFQRL